MELTRAVDGDIVLAALTESAESAVSFVAAAAESADDSNAELLEATGTHAHIGLAAALARTVEQQSDDVEFAVAESSVFAGAAADAALVDMDESVLVASDDGGAGVDLTRHDDAEEQVGGEERVSQLKGFLFLSLFSYFLSLSSFSFSFSFSSSLPLFH